MTKEEFKEEYEQLMMEVLNEKDLEKRKILNQKLKELKSKYKKNMIKDINKDRRVLK
ncbi:MAG: hypothetical protein IK997_06060 [Bacilli bacterium]|nr:hypothetical protein [Bacilli bacterium]